MALAVCGVSLTRLGELFIYPDFGVVDGLVAPGTESKVLTRSGVTFDLKEDSGVLCIRENEEYAS